MKKFLLSLVSLLMVVLFAQAGEVKIAYPGGSTTNMTGENDAASFGLSKDDWSIVGAKGGNSNYPGLNKAGDFRLYYHKDGGNTITVTVLKEGAVIKKITGMSFNTGLDNVTVSVGGELVEPVDGAYTINATSFVLGNGNTSNVQVQIKEITLDVDGLGSDIATPVISPNGGYFLNNQEVTFSCETEGAAIYYTIDGSDPANGNKPSESATRYERTLLVTENGTVVRAVAFKDGAKSAEATATFIQIQSYSTLTSLNALADKTPFAYTGQLMVTAKPTAKYVYVNDGTSFGLIYDGTGEKTAAAEKGKYITPGWTGKVSIYKQLFELVPDNAIAVTEDPAQPFNYLDEPISEATINKVIILKGVTSYSAKGNDLTIIINDEKELSEAYGAKGYNQFEIVIPAADPEKTYEIIGAVGKYNDQLQFWPITIQEPQEPQPEPELNFYVTGTIAEWGIVEANKMTLNEDLEKEGIKEFYLTMDLKANDGIKVVSSYDGLTDVSWYPDGSGNEFVAPADGKYTVYCRPNFDGDETWIEKCLKVEAVKSNDYTSYIVNADLTGEGGFDATGTKGIDGSGIVKVGSAAAFDFKQTIENLPAGQYKLTVQAAYRYGDSEEAEYTAIQTEDVITKLVQLYATVGKKTVVEYIQNRYDGVSKTDYANGDGSVTVNNLYVPNSSDAVKAWFAAGQYVNELVFNLPVDGAVTIGVNRVGTPESDYTVIGPWTLTRLGDAEEEPEPKVLADGKYYFKNIATGLFWGAGNSWGTQASLVKEEQYGTIAKLEDGTYTLESMVSNGGTSYYFNGSYMDNGAPVHLTITEVKDGVFTIANGETFYGSNGSSTVLAAVDANSEGALWSVLTQEDIDAAHVALLAKATPSAAVDASALILDNGFGRNRRDGATVWNANGVTLGGPNSDVANYCSESYHKEFSIAQPIAVPNGVYAITAQGFYRQDGSDNENLPVFYANDVVAQFPLLTTGEGSMAAAGTTFLNGGYTIDPIWVKVTDGTLTVGAKLETNTTLWCIWDNFQMKYYGDCEINEAKNAAIIAKVAELRETATGLQDAEGVVEAAKTGLSDALTATAEVEQTEEALNAAIATLEGAIDKAEAGVIAARVLPAMKDFVATTNFYTADALAAYYTSIQEKYENATLTKDEANALQNPATITDWHAAVTVDDLLCSIWDVEPADWNSLHVNTWSNEGETDGSEFKVPFFEYWTGDGDSLGEKTMTATIDGLEAGKVAFVNVWVRARAKNNVAAADATGITLQVNDGEAVDVTEGEQVGNSQFNLGKYTARGVVGEDGKLVVKFIVAAENNVSWLSFKNANYELKDPTQVAYEDALEAIKDGQTYRVFTVQNETKYYLNNAGKLVTDELKAATFTFNAVKAKGTLYETGWNLGCKFTNPSLTNGSSGDVVQTGGINVGGNDRDDWERQVFFLNGEGKYAVRATNANSANWGANTYWDLVEYETLPAAGYSLNPSYVWQIEENVDNRPEAFAKVQTWAAKLQTAEGLVTSGDQWISNAKQSSEGSYAALVDGNYETFFHSQYNGTNPNAYHYLQATLSEPVQDFYFYMKKRSQNQNNRPTDIAITASNDGENFADVTEISEGLPTTSNVLDYTSGKISMDQPYQTIRFTVKNTNSGAKFGDYVFFTASEWYILPSNEMTDAAAKYMNAADYTDLAYEDIEPINALEEQIEVAYQQVLLKEELADLAACAARAKEFVTNYPANVDADVVSGAIKGIDEIAAAEYTTKEEIAEAKESVYTFAQLFVVAAGTPTADADITEWFVENYVPTANSEGWTVINGTAENQWAGNTYDAGNNVAEFWNYAGSTIKQAITLPAGCYKLTAVALQRTDMTGYVFAGEKQVNLVTVADDVVNSRAQAAAWFTAGNGVNEVPFIMATMGEIEIGITTDKATGDHWTVWQSFKLERCVPPAVVLNAPTFNAEEGTQAEPNIYPADFKLKINYSADNLQENGYNAEDLKVKVTVMVSGDLPENMMTMGSTTAHRVLGETFYIDLGETDFPVELKQGYVYQNISVMASTLVKPAAAGSEEEEKTIAVYNTAPVQLHWIGIKAPVVLNAPTLNATEGTQQEPTMYPADFKLKINYSADNLEENGYKAEDLKVKVMLMVAGDLPENMMSMGSPTAHSVRAEIFYLPLGEEEFPVALKPGYVYSNIVVMSSQLVKPAVDGGVEEIVAIYSGEPVQLHWIGLEAVTYDITIAETANGTVEADKAKAADGETVTVTVTPDEGYMVDQAYWSFIDETGTEVQSEFQEPEDGGNSAIFTMPAAPVTITVIFKVATGIKGIAADGENATIYDLSGRKVEKMQRGGIYIVNGKKVSFK